MRRAIGIIAATIAAAGIAGCGGGSDTTTGGTTDTGAPPATTAASTTATSPAETGAPVSNSTCSTPTDATTEGPYYVTGTAELTDGNLNYDDLPGDTIAIAGYVYSGTAKNTPLANAIVDVWQTDDSGAYWPESNGPASGYTAEQLSLRGHVVTDARGYYRFTTVYPGEYEGRARHIHIRAASADSSKDVVTQLIMSKEGDQTPATADNIARSLPECHTMRFSTLDGVATAFFDFHL